MSTDVQDAVIRLMSGWTEIIGWFQVQHVENFVSPAFQTKVTHLLTWLTRGYIINNIIDKKP